MTEKEYEKWCHNLNLVGQDIEEYSHRISSLRDICSSLDDRHHNLKTLEIGFHYDSNDGRKTYWGFDEKRNNKIKELLRAEIEDELKEYQSLYDSAKDTRTRMIEALKEEN